MSTEYGIFQSIVEGDQADAYKKRKAQEQRASDKAARDRSIRKSAASQAAEGEENYNNRMENLGKKLSSNKNFRDKIQKANDGSVKDAVDAIYATDAYERHQRRHGNNESTINFI